MISNKDIKVIDMFAFTNDELRAISPEELNSLKEKAEKGDNIAKYKTVMCVLYAQDEKNKDHDIHQYLKPSETSNDEMAFLLLGYAFEHAIGTSKNYAKAVECYSRAFDLLNNIQPSAKGTIQDGSNAFKEMEKRYDNLVNQVNKIISVKKFCQFNDGQFIFPWTQETRNSLNKLLPQLSNDIAKFGELYAKAITNLKDEEQGEWEFRYQDTLLTPLEIMKTLAARDSLEQYFVENGHQVFPADPYFNNALGRCLIDDDDAYDNDYIIGGLLNMAGHEENPLWQYRAGLWYEYCDNNLEPKAAAYWYEQAKKGLPAANTALERLQNSLNYRILINAKEGTAKECQSLLSRSSKNPQNSVGWLIEKALRGDESAIQRLENNQYSPKGQSSIFGSLLSTDDPQPYYSLLYEEKTADKKAALQWEKMMQAEKDAYRRGLEEEARKKAEAERKRIEAERKVKEEAARKAREAEEAKRRAEEKKKEYERRCKNLVAEIKDIEIKYKTLTDKWEKEGLEQYKHLRQQLRDAEEKMESLLKETTRKWWQVPFYNSGTMSVQEVLTAEHNVAKESLDRLEVGKTEIEKESDKLERNLDTKGIENNKNLLETKLIDSQKSFKSYNKLVNEAFKSIDSVNTLINRFRDGSIKTMVEPIFSIRRTFRYLLTTCMVVSIILDLFDIPYSALLFWLSSCCLGVHIVGKRYDYSFDGILKGVFAGLMGGIILQVLLWIILSLFGGCGSSSSESSSDTKTDISTLQNTSNGEPEKSVIDESETDDSEDNTAMATTTEDKYDYVYSEDSDGWRKIEKNGKKGFIDKTGKEVVPPKYDYIYSPEDNGWRKVELSNKKGFINAEGVEIVPVIYDYINSPDESGWRKVEKNGKKGFINEKGEEVVPPIYDYIYSWSGGLAKVEKDDKTGYINRQGKLVQAME